MKKSDNIQNTVRQCTEYTESDNSRFLVLFPHVVRKFPSFSYKSCDCFKSEYVRVLKTIFNLTTISYTLQMTQIKLITLHKSKCIG